MQIEPRACTQLTALFTTAVYVFVSAMLPSSDAAMPRCCLQTSLLTFSIRYPAQAGSRCDDYEPCH